MKFGFSTSNSLLCENHFSNEQEPKTDVRRMNLHNSAERHQEGSEQGREGVRKLRKGERKVVKTVKQLELLRSFYEENPLPTPCTYQRIATQAGLTAR